MTLFKYLDWLFPDIAECFFPIMKNEERRYHWPGIGRAVQCLLLEVICFVTAIFISTMLTLSAGFVLATGRACDPVICGLPLASGSTKGKLFPVTKLDASKRKLTPAIIQGFMSRSEPLIIKNLPKDLFSELAPGGGYAPPQSQEMVERGTVMVKNNILPRSLGGFGQWIQEYVQKPVLYMLRLSGSYGSQSAHMDGVMYNIYYVVRGRKRVWICPGQYNPLLKFESAGNALMIPESGRSSSNPLKWIESVPGVWNFELEAGDVLLFNNTCCVHKFVNLTENPEVFSVRVPTSAMSPLVTKFHLFNWSEGRDFARLIFTRADTGEMLPIGDREATRKMKAAK